MDLSQSEMSVSHAADAKFGEFDPKGQFGIRDLGLIKATGGALDARIIKANGPCPGKLGLHRHDVEFQMFYVLKGVGQVLLRGHRRSHGDRGRLREHARGHRPRPGGAF